MQSGVDQVKEIIEEDIWGSILEFFRITLFSFQSGEDVIKITVGLILFVIAVFFLTSFLLRGTRMVVTRKMDEADRNKFISIFRFIKYLTYLIVVIILISTAGIDITILLTASAALFVGLGLALQDLFKDIIGGLYIIIDKTLVIGDIIEINGKIGRVIEIKLRTARILTRDDKVMVIPNHKFITDIVLNYTQNHKATSEFVRVGVAYGSDTLKVKKVLLECTMEQPGIIKKPDPFVLFEDFGDSALIFTLHFFVTDSFVDPKIKSELRFKIEEKFRLNNISIPFPQRDVHTFDPQQPK